MRSFLLLIFLLFVFVAAHASENVAVKCEGPVKAAVGENVTFLCFLQHPFKAVDISLVTWKLGSRAVYRYRSGKEDLIDQAKEFVNKTSLSNFTINGNVSLMLTNVTKEHEGNYTCGVKVSKLYTEDHVNLSVDQKTNSSNTGNVSKEKPGNDHTTIIIIVGGIAVIVAGIVIYRKCRNSKKRTSPESQTDPPSEEGHSKHLRKRLTSTSSSSSSSQTSEQNSGTSHEQSNNLLPEDSCE